MPVNYIYTEVEGQRLKLTNLDKIIYPNIEGAKAQLIQYYLNISEYILPFIKNRALTLIRFPDGIDKHKFYTKNLPSWTPEWMSRLYVPWDRDNTYLHANKASELVWLANLAALEIHIINSRKASLEKPDHFVIDLDPSTNHDFNDIKRMAFQLKSFLEDCAYVPFVKTSGSKGLHLIVPIHTEYSYEAMTTSIKSLMKEFIAQGNGGTLSVHKENRKGEILLDIYRNHPSNTTVAPFSLRALPGAPVSMPVRWEYLESVKSAQDFNISNTLDFLKENGNPWSGIFESSRALHTKGHSSIVPNKTSEVKTLSSQRFDCQEDLNFDMEHMLCGVSKDIPLNHTKYLYEIKWDGIRVFVIVTNNKVKILSRSGRDITDQFPEFQSIDFANKNCVLDGELVCLGDDGKPVFHNIISRMHTSSPTKIAQLSKSKKAYLMCFDCVNIEGKDIINYGLGERREILKSVVNESSIVRISQTYTDGKELLIGARKMNLEGIIAKLRDSKYTAGERSDNWLKIKFRESKDVIIIGYTGGKGDRKDLFGALHMADIKDSQLVYLGKVGTGFNNALMKDILVMLRDIKVVSKEINTQIEEENKSTWIEPVLRCEVSFASWTNNNTLREPVFLKMIEVK